MARERCWLPGLVAMAESLPGSSIRAPPSAAACPSRADPHPESVIRVAPARLELQLSRSEEAPEIARRRVVELLAGSSVVASSGMPGC